MILSCVRCPNEAAGREDGKGELPGGATGWGEENSYNGWP